MTIKKTPIRKQILAKLNDKIDALEQEYVNGVQKIEEEAEQAKEKLQDDLVNSIVDKF